MVIHHAGRIGAPPPPTRTASFPGQPFGPFLFAILSFAKRLYGFWSTVLTPVSQSDSRWTRKDTTGGTAVFRLESWSHFFDFIETELFHPAKDPQQSLVWRGQRRSDWSLSTTLDRHLETLGLLSASPEDLEELSVSHLDAFKYAARGRRGPNPASLSENEWWALGQHFGLDTPLLDWTRSPFAACYFAFEEIGRDPTPYRVVYALNEDAVFQKNRELVEGPSLEKGRPPVLEIVDPLSDENQRLVSQGGCFTRSPIGNPVEQWVARAFEDSKETVLLRIEVPDTDRLTCLRALNRMNINHSSLFPDLMGASRSTNMKLDMESTKGE